MDGIIIDAFKYNYKNGKKKKVQLGFMNGNIFYSYKRKIKLIETVDILGIIYGPRVTTFLKVKNCIPWKCFSLVLRSRTYDFESLNYNDYKDFSKEVGKYLNFTFEYLNDDKKKWMIINEKNCKNYSTYYEWMKSYNCEIQESEEQSRLDNLFNDECPICLDTFDDAENIKILNCNHAYHYDCIRYWLTTKKNCPVCRVTPKNIQSITYVSAV